MKALHFRYVTYLTFCLLIFIVGCQYLFDEEDPVEENNDDLVEEIIILSESGNSIKEFLSIKLSANVLYKSGELEENAEVRWSTSSFSIAEVLNDGTVNAKTEGEVIITATYQEQSGEIKLTVVKNPIINFIIDLKDTIIVSHEHDLSSKIVLESGDTLADDENVVWSLSNNLTGIVEENIILGIKEGPLDIRAEFNDFLAEKSIFVSAIEETEIDEYLSTPAKDCIKEVPVVVIRYLPTADGINIDIRKAPDYWTLGEISLEDMILRINKFDHRVKFMLEEGSKFRGYKSLDNVPYLGYKVIKYFTVYEQLDISNFAFHQEEGHNIYRPDYFEMFERLNIEHFVNELNAKEIWIWHGYVAPGLPSYDPSLHNPQDFVGMMESNMSSPTTGDISNSYRVNDDLPIYNNTYVVYGQNMRRTQAEAVHNHGHQLESILNYVAYRQDRNHNLFVNDFCGWGGNYLVPPLGRAGDCHHPPNTNIDYDYENYGYVESDIEDWKPDNSGEKKLVNCQTWGSIDYKWPSAVASNIPQKIESHWYIYWMQNMPGYQNGIPYSGSKKMTNWWEFTADWDKAIKEGKGLHQ